MKSPNYSHFAAAPQVQLQRSAFDRSRTYKTAFNSGLLIPVYLDEVLPGDTFNLKLTAFARLATPTVPIMDNIYLDFQFFYVPNRLLWSNWERFNGARDNPVTDYESDTQYTIPQISASITASSLGDYFGIPPTSSTSPLSFNALPFRAYNLIWNEWYRDENLQNSVTVTTGDSDTISNYQLLRRGKRHDRFTSCLPWPQKGPGVELPLGGVAPVVGNGHALVFEGRDDNSSATKYAATSCSAGSISWWELDSPSMGSPFVKESTNPFSNPGLSSNYFSGISQQVAHSGLQVNLSDATAISINSLREAFQIQRLYERDARGGTRYTEILRSHFGVISPDARLQRPEYLGGGSMPIQIHSVAQTSATETTVTPQGNLAAYALTGGTVGFNKSFVEHGYIIGLASVRADLTYQQGLDKLWSRRGRFDFYWPTLAHLGEEPVYNREIYAQGNAVVDAQGVKVDDKVFGYQERWSEYRYGTSLITGQLRSSYAESLDVWHLAQNFSSLPTLNSSFIQDNPPLRRSLAITDEDYPEIIYDSLISCKCIRPMPVYSVPGLVDHF